jgi:hypothetical protein
MNPGKNVVLRGLPGKMMEKGVEGLLKGLGFAGSEGDKWEAVKVEK